MQCTLTFVAKKQGPGVSHPIQVSGNFIRKRPIWRKYGCCQAAWREKGKQINKNPRNAPKFNTCSCQLSGNVISLKGWNLQLRKEENFLLMHHTHSVEKNGDSWIKFYKIKAKNLSLNLNFHPIFLNLSNEYFNEMNYE